MQHDFNISTYLPFTGHTKGWMILKCAENLLFNRENCKMLRIYSYAMTEDCSQARKFPFEKWLSNFYQFYKHGHSEDTEPLLCEKGWADKL